MRWASCQATTTARTTEPRGSAEIRSAGPPVVSPLAGSRGRSGTPRPENPRSPAREAGDSCWREETGAGDARGREVCALQSSGGGGSWIHLPGMCLWHSLSRESVSSPVLADEFSDWRAQREKERERAPSREEALPAFAVHLRPCPRPLRGCSESLPDISENVKCLLQGEKGGFIFCLQKGNINIPENIGRQKEKLSRSSQYNFLSALAPPPPPLSDANVHWGLYGKIEGGREGFNLLYASEATALIVPLRGSCHLFSSSFLTTLLCTNKRKANRHYALASVNIKHESWQRKLNRLPLVCRLQVNGLTYLINRIL